MRRTSFFLLTLSLTLLLSVCEGKEAEQKRSFPSVDTPSQTQTPETALTKENPTSPTQTEVTDASTVCEAENSPLISSILEEHPKVDIDLTGFSSNMLYAEVYNMEMNPSDYKGKVISITGDYVSFPRDVDNNGNPISDEEIFVCLISDAMACCQRAIEFIPEKNSMFWKERPAEGSKITITGICDIFLDESGWFTIIQLDNTKIERQN